MASDPPTTPDSTAQTANLLQIQAAEILDRVSDAFLMLDREWRIVYANREACRINQKPLEEFVGKTHWDEWPAAVGTDLERRLRRAMDERVDVHFEHHYVSEPYDVWLENDVYPTADGLSIFYRDITARKRAEESLRRSREDLQLAVDAADIGTFYCDFPLDKIVWNETCKTHFFLPPDADVDINLFYSLLHPEDRARTRQAIERALDEHVGYDVEYRTQGPDGQTRWVNAVGRFYYDDAGEPLRFDGITLDITARKAAEAALRASESARRISEERLQDAQARLEAALDAGGIATWTWDVLNDRVVADANLTRLFSVSAQDAEGGRIKAYVQAIHPEDRTRVTDAIEEALAHGDTYEAEYRVVLPDGSHRWLATRGRVERDAQGRAVALPGVVLDITERAERGQRERFLAELAERAREITDPDAVIADALRSVGAFLGVDRCAFVDIDIEGDSCTAQPDYRAHAGVVSMAGTFPLSAFGDAVVAAYGAGQPVIVDDVWNDPEQVPPASIPTYDAIGIRAHLSVPVVHSACLVSCIGVHSATPRHWKPEEVELLRTVVERTWLTVAVTRHHRALAEVAEEQRARAEREALLNRIGQALRGSPAPEIVLETAVRELGLALSADRCYYAAYNQNADTAMVGPDWHRDGLPSLAGSYPISSYAINHDPIYRSGRTQVIADTTSDQATHGLGLHALIRVPLVSGAAMTALSVAMTTGPREWSAEEVSLVEAVATQTQTALEAVRLQRREHRIAEQLQDALQPALPEHVPGLSMGKFTRPALEEASVGGDFYDVFPLDKELYAIVIGDVSGKGLAAAQQLALIRNSLRTTLYLFRSPAQAVSSLNAIVTAQDLLVGFVTTWVGVYDAGSGSIAYCSCGHEPALISRTTGQVEALESTGPPLGVAENAVYQEARVVLSSGDALLLYTDGISEAGTNRREMLGTAGLTRILSTVPPGQDAQVAAETLVASVSAFTNDVFRDDVAVLFTRRQ